MSAIHTINGQEIVAYGDMFEYVEDADFTDYEKTGAYEGDYITVGFKPVDDPDFCTSSNDTIELNDGELYQKVWFGEDFDDRHQYVKEFNIDDEVFIIYVWNEKISMYVAFNGVAYSSEEDAQAKMKEINEG